MSLEHELRRALRAEDPGEAFTARVLERVRQDAASRAARAEATGAPGQTQMGPGPAPRGEQPPAADISEMAEAPGPIVIAMPSTERSATASASQPTPGVVAAAASDSIAPASSSAIEISATELSTTASGMPLPTVSDPVDPARPVVLAWPDAATRPETRASQARRRGLGTSSSRSRARWIWVSTMAASLLVSAAGGVQWMKYRREVAEGERARAEVLAALRLTSEKLSLVRQAVARAEAPADGGELR